jgi:hypothetical protein
MREQIRGMKTLTRFVARDQRQTIIDLEGQLNELIRQVDNFYLLLGPRHWIYHDLMNTDKVAEAIRNPAAKAERALIEYYKSDGVSLMARTLRGLPQMAPRMPLVERAQRDYKAGRYYSTVMVLIAAMDGLVNDVDTAQRRGLHARDENEMSAWDSVVGHHLGLAKAHRTFTKTFAKTSDEEVHELYRNGIVHGTLINFDNDVVATKAWNRLFAVADWAKGVEKQVAPTEPKPTWRGLIGQIRQNTADRETLNTWRPSSLERGESGFENDPLYGLANAYLNGWKTKNYGQMAAALAALTTGGDPPGKVAGQVRDEYSLIELEDFEITRLDFRAAAICEIDVDLTSDGKTHAGRMRWIRENNAGEVVLPNQAGDWRLISWGPWAMLNPPARESDEEESGSPF